MRNRPEGRLHLGALGSGYGDASASRLSSAYAGPQSPIIVQPDGAEGWVRTPPPPPPRGGGPRDSWI